MKSMLGKINIELITLEAMVIKIMYPNLLSAYVEQLTRKTPAMQVVKAPLSIVESI